MNHPAFLKVDKATFYRFIATAPENERYEYVRGRIVQQQAGGTFKHVRIGRRISLLIEAQLGPDRWIVNSGSDRGVETSESIRFPDVVLEPVGAPPNSLATSSPAFVAEVLSPTSSDRDLVEKPDEYLSLPSLQAYVIASQSEPTCLVWVRDADGRFPAEPSELQGDGALIAVPALGLTIPIADIYRGIL